MDSLKDFKFDWKQDPKTLRRMYKSTNFDFLFHKLIAKDVINVFSPQLVPEPYNLSYDDAEVYKHLISPLERFICNSDVEDQSEKTQEKVDHMLGHLKSLKQTSKMCRKVLKTGDVLFSCNDCGFDATCVVCIDCFLKSEHKNHNYRMSNTDGGGCCDCGDIEAWKQHPSCSDHAAIGQMNLNLSDFEDIEKRAKQIENDRSGILEKISLLPDEGLASRFFLVCQACLHYARAMLSWNDFIKLPEYLEIDDENFNLKHLLSNDPASKNFFTVLFNDEVHTYDYVIDILVKLIDCTKMTASVMASSVSREGRSYILLDHYESCCQIRNIISYARESHQSKLKVEVMHGSVLAHQAYALKLIEWIQRMSLTCDAFRVITAFTLLGDYDPIPGQEDVDIGESWTLLDKIMLSNTSYWKIARILWNDLFVSTLLTEYSIKEKFARLVTRLYPRLIDDFIKDDHDHSVSILTMTTQLYTVPSLVCMLIEEENALSIISRTLVRICSFERRESSPMLGFRYAFESMKRGFSIISDFRHLISTEPAKWTPKLRENIVRAVKIFLELLLSMQGMDSVKRQIGQHLEYEPEWEAGMNLQSRLIALINRLVTYCSFDEQVLREVLSETQQMLFKDGGFKRVSQELLGYHTYCIQYNVSMSPVSVHLPLTRFAASLIIELMQRKPCDTVPYDESLVILANSTKDNSYYLRATHSDTSANKNHSMIDIMEHSLRTAVMLAQFRSGMWRRNGFSLVNQILYFTGALMRKEMFDRDILCIQEAAATCEANKFMIHLLNKFNIFTWINSETTREPLFGPKAVSFYNDEEILAQTMSLAEEFLQLLLTVVSERYRVGIGKIQPDDVMKNEIIHLLCLEPSTRSDLAQKLYVNDTELDCIKAVANLRRSNESSLGKYELKEEFYNNFNPFFYHYSRRQQSQALDAQLKRKRNLKEPLNCCPPPAPVELTDQFRNLNELLKCDITLMIIQKILRRALGPPADAKECSTKAPIRFTASDLQLDQCLHLIGLGLFEQERNPVGFNYLMAAQNSEIFFLLRECYEKAKRSKDLIYWVMKKASNVIDLLDTMHANNLDEQQSRVYSDIKNCFGPILSTCDTIKQESKKRNSELSAQRRERIMAMMRAKQEKFLLDPTTKQLADETAKHEAPHVQSNNQQHYPVGMATNTTNTTTTTTANASSMDYENGSAPLRSSNNEGSGVGEEDDEKMDSESIGATMTVDETKRTHYDGRKQSSYLCILCRDEQCVGFDKPTMVLLAYIQRSTVLSKNRNQRKIPHYTLTQSNHLKNLILSQPDLKIPSEGGCSPEKYSYTSDNSWSFDATFMPSDLFFGPYVSTCSHAMHYDCWRGYMEAISKRDSSRPNRTIRQVSYELKKNEILCPLCECISNATIPLLPDFNQFVFRNPQTDIHGVFGVQASTIERSSENLAVFLNAIRSSVAKVKHVRHLQKPTQQPSQQHQQQHDDKYMRLLQPTPINDALKELKEDEALALRDFVTTIRNEKISSAMCTKNLLSTISTLAERIHFVGLNLDNTIGDVDHARIFMMTSWSISYTIQGHERSSRYKKTPLFGDLESVRNLCAGALVRFACASMMTHQSDMIQSLLVRKLRYLLVSDEYLMSSPCCLDIDTFELFVSLFIMLQKLYSHLDEPAESLVSTSELLSSSFKSTSSRSSGAEDQNYAWTTRAYNHEFFRNLLHLTLLMHMVQVIISMQSKSLNFEKEVDNEESAKLSDEAMDGDDDCVSNECVLLHNFYKDILMASDHPNTELPAMNEQLVKRVRRALLPFLRSCAIFFQQLSRHNPPDELVIAQASQDLEFSAICKYLSLPTSFVSILRNQEACKLARTWLHHSRVQLLIEGLKNEQSPVTQSKNELMPLKFIRQPHSVNRLISLPYDYSELVDKVSNFTCPSIKNEDSRTPTMCLVCGKMLCSQSYCCQRDLNNLASNHQNVLRLQDEVHQRMMVAMGEGNRESGSVAAASGLTHHHRTRANVAAARDRAAQQQATPPGLVYHGGRFHLNQANTGQQDQAARAAGTGGNGNPFASAAVTAPLEAPSAAYAVALSAYVPADRERLNLWQQLVGSCTYHSYECSGGVGIFLRIRNCQVLLLSNRTKGCYMPAPYIDDHGETDFGLLRGNPLHLNKQHYERLQQLWLSHSIPEQVSRTLENSSHASNINWYLH